MKKFMVVIIVILIIAVGGLIALNFSGYEFVETTTETSETKTITFFEKNKEIALVTLGISDIYEKENTATVFKKKLPGSKKQVYIRGSFDAKLGIDGKNVVVTETGEKEYTINIPEFIFIGYNNVKFEVAVESNGLLSFATDDIDQAAMVSEVLNPVGQEQYMEKYTALLKESAEEFYKNLIPSTETDVVLKFTYDD
jgi:hypothetical protein